MGFQANTSVPKIGWIANRLQSVFDEQEPVLAEVQPVAPNQVRRGRIRGPEDGVIIHPLGAVQFQGPLVAACDLGVESHRDAPCGHPIRKDTGGFGRELGQELCLILEQGEPNFGKLGKAFPNGQGQFTTARTASDDNQMKRPGRAPQLILQAVQALDQSGQGPHRPG